ncbi:MAG: competence/damage-inducible protein A [Thermoanaerobaculia bacterium]
MRAAIIAVGSEMLGPSRVDTNSLKVTAALEDFGIPVVRKSVVGDLLDDLAAEIIFALTKADLLIISGGLGPTEDDLTREAIVKALGLKTSIDQAIIDRLETRFRARGWTMPEVNMKQATVFEGQETLQNERGTAPGHHLHVLDQHLWVFPGVPSELEWMLATYFIPWLERTTSGRTRQRRVLKISGLGESAVEEKLAPYYAVHRDELLTILASPGGVELHLNGDGPPEEARAKIAEREKELRMIFGRRIFGVDDDTLESSIGDLLASRSETLSTAESCTGGLFSSRVTDVSGSSRYFMGGAICYTGDAKIAMADVDPELIRQHGEVSQEVAIAMAEGVRRRFNTTYGVGITGIAGPSGGSEAKPVGTVHIAVADAQRHEHRKFYWPGTRSHVKWFSTQSALDLLRRFVLER